MPPGTRDKLPHLVDAVLDAITPEIDIPHTGWVDVHVGGLENVGYNIRFAFEGIDGPSRLRFDDNSELFAHSASQYGDEERDRIEPLDDGPRLLEPITAVELAGLEPVLAQLWLAIDNQALTAAQQHQIMAMAELLKAQQLAAQPGQTERWKLVGPLRAVLTYLAKEAPRDALAWWKLAELLHQIDWSTLAGELPT